MTKCWVFNLLLQLFIGIVLWNFIKCDCPFPKEEILNGHYIYVDPTDAIDSDAEEEYILFFGCSKGYVRVGARGIQCVDGKWSGEVPSCKAMPCGYPPRIINGTYTLTANDIAIGTQAIYSCNRNHELSDPSVSRLTCMLNGDGDEALWAGDIPDCQAMKPCSDPGFSKVGSRKGDCFLPGCTVSYSCNEGYEMVGEKDIECLLTKSWSSPRPLCRPLGNHCELPPEIPNGVVVRPSGDYALPGEEVEILCKPGYNFNGPNQYPYCNESALWEDEFGECEEIFCARPGPLANGDIPELEKSDFKETLPNNFVLTYDCNEGYRLKGGEPWRYCTKDGWSGKDLYCEEIMCPDPGALQEGSRVGDSFKVGAKVRFKCFTGFQLLGSVERYCRPTGKWTGELARCNAPTNYCPNPGTPINGIRNGESYDEGDEIEFRCRSGFIQVGSKVRTCMSDRTWNGTETRCLAPHDFDSPEEVGRNLKQRLYEQFDEETKQFKMYLPAEGGRDEAFWDIPSSGRLIMYFAFDVSGSIRKTNFDKSIELAKTIVEKIGVSEDGTRVGALTFDTVGDNAFFPMDYQNTQDVLRELDGLEYWGGGTTPSVLHKLIEMMKLVEKNISGNKKTVLFLITDGRANMGDSPENDAKILKEKLNAEIFCIGITGDQHVETLYQIASTSTYDNQERPNVFILKNYKTMDWLIQELKNGTIDYSQCGVGMESKMKSDEGRMVGGELSLEPWPWMATLFYKDPEDKAAKAKLKCGGSVISENFILTAAHCLFQREKQMKYRERGKDEIIVKLGLVNLKNYPEIVQEFAVETIFIHDNYSSGNTYDYDIALLKLNRPITYTTFLRPVCLPPAVLPDDKNSTLYKDGEYGWVAGFRHNERLRPLKKDVQYRLSNQLKELRLPIQENEWCISSPPRWLKHKNFFTERMFCAGDGLSSNDACNGDSGSPFMQPQMNSQGTMYWTQVGIVIWDVGCGNKGRYGYYTNVQRFRDWIDEKTKEIVPEAEEMNEKTKEIVPEVEEMNEKTKEIVPEAEEMNAKTKEIVPEAEEVNEKTKEIVSEAEEVNEI